jgi:hypothetical protein
MLGIGPRPEPATDDDLAAEGPDVEVIAFGREMRITSPAGATFLITEARSATPGSVHLRGPADEPLSLRDLVARLLDSVDRSDGGGTGANTGEVTLPDCKTRIEDDALIIDLPEVGAVHFVRGDPSAGQGPAVSVFMPDGDTATIDQLLGALSQGLASPQAAALRRQEAEAMAADRSYGDDPGPDVAGDDPTPAAPCRIPLSIRLPDELAAKAANVALLLIRGLPRGADLSAGVASGDGSWLLSPRDLVGLSLAPPPAWTVDLALEVAAIAVQDQDGGLASASQTLLVPPLSAPGGEPRAPIPIALDPQMLSAPEAPLDAIVIRLPAGATLSAGTYDAAIDGWVLLPPQMSGLTVKVDGEPAEDFTLTLLGISLSDGRARSRLLAQIPLAIR